MNKSVCDKQTNKELPLPRSSSDDCVHLEVPSTTVTNTNKHDDALLNYKNISLTLTGEISSPCICRNNITRKQAAASFVDNTEEDDEQFILNIKENIDKNNKMLKKENYNVRDLQTKSYLSRRKRSTFNEEDQNLMKRFKRSIDDKKAALRPVPQNLQQPEDIASVIHRDCSMTTASCSTPKIKSAVVLNNVDANSRNSTDECLPHTFTKMQDNDRFVASTNLTTISETEIEHLIYYETHYLTPPVREELNSS